MPHRIAALLSTLALTIPVASSWSPGPFALDVAAQNLAGEPPLLEIRYRDDAGPEVAVKKDEAVLSDFRLDGMPFGWPLDVAMETLTPTPARAGVGFRLTANAIAPGGKPCQVRVFAHASDAGVELRGLTPEKFVTFTCRISTKHPSVGLKSRISERFEPPLLQASIGDTEGTCDSVYDGGPDRMIFFQPAALTTVGRAAADGSRTVAWNVKPSASGDVNAILVRIEEEYLAGQYHFPRQALKGWRVHAPRAGWRSHAAYGRALSTETLAAEAEQIRAKLQPFGMDELQIDDGWQDAESRPAESPWRPDPKSFPNGLAPAVEKIRSLGLTPSLWLVPQAANVADGTPGILTNFQGKPAPGGAFSPRWWDGTTPAGRDELRRIVEGFVKQGFRRFYFDGQTEFLRIYKQNLKLNENVFDGQRAYRDSLSDLLKLAGDGSRIAAGGAGVMRGEFPTLTSDPAGVADSIQILDDRLDKNWTFEKGIAAVALGARFHGWALDADPGFVRVGDAVAPEIARSWATLVALTGQRFFISERVASLAEDRLETLRRTIGGPAVRSIQAPAECVTPRRVRLWRDLDGELALVTGHFSFDTKEQPVSIESEGPRVAEFARAEKFDFWGNRFLGRGEIETVEHLPNIERKSCLVVVARKAKDVPMVLATSRHVTQGSGDLTKEAFNASTGTLSAECALVAGDPYEVRVVVPSREWAVREAKADGVECQVNQEGRLVRIAMTPKESRKTALRAQFVKVSDGQPVPAAEVVALKAANGGGASVRLAWSEEKSKSGHFLVKRDGAVIGSATSPRFLDASPGLRFGVKYNYVVVPVDDLGQPGAAAAVEYLHSQPLRTSIGQLGFQNRRRLAGSIVENYSAVMTELAVGGAVHRTGLGVAAPSIFDVPLRGAAGTLVATLAIDDVAGANGSAEVIVKIDDTVAVKSPVIRGGGQPYELRVPINPGSKSLTFEVNGTADGTAYDFVDILSPEIHFQGRR